MAFGELPEAMKLANKIAKCSTIDDLKDLAKSIGESLDGYTLFDRIADSTLPMDEDPINGYKYEMLTELSGGYDDDYDNAFERLVDTQIHGPIGDNSSYLFEDGNNGYKLMLTQLNKADIEEKLLAPTYHDSA
ncbi:MAG: hypothetical protein MJ233_04295 [Mycoplasmoidaceae bacterium]|nr:hypothetical protein [Mycoplasmoidaceae bacterium]